MSEWKLSPEEELKTRDGYVADKLREAILRGHLKPGHRLDQNEIAELLNVSRSPVREALRTLAAEGLVTVHPHRSAVVAELSLEEFKEISQIRVVLEGIAARDAAPNMDEVRITFLKRILDELNETSDPDRWVELNRSFHHTIYRAINRPRLLALIQNLRNTMAPYIRQHIRLPEHREAARSGHERILAACIDRDGKVAQKETEIHLKTVYEEALEYLASSLSPPAEQP